jgi:hypothetical protein
MLVYIYQFHSIEIDGKDSYSVSYIKNPNSTVVAIGETFYVGF